MSVSCDVKSDMECLAISTKACVHSGKKHRLKKLISSVRCKDDTHGVYESYEV